MKVVEEFHQSASGIDWLTVTSTSNLDGARMQQIFDDMKARYEPDNETIHWNWQGFAGRSSRYCAYGWREKDDRHVIMLKSDVARKNYWRLSSLNGKITRMDVQVTLSFTKPVDLIDKFLQYAANKHRKPKLISGGSDVSSETLTIGQRGAVRFLRVYDKGLEADTADRHMVWRIEFELKGKPASEVYTKLMSIQRIDDDVYSAIVSGLCRDMGVMLPLALKGSAPDIHGVDLLLNNDAKSQYTDKERWASWLSASVKPVIFKLMLMGEGELVMRQLGFFDEMEVGGNVAAEMRRAIDKLYNNDKLW